MGLDVAYLKIEGMSTSTGVIAGAGVFRPTQTQPSSGTLTTRTTGWLASASIATSIPDRLIMGV